VGEFELIRRYFQMPAEQPLGQGAGTDDLLLGIGDDCALLRPQADGSVLAVSIDTLVEGTHFLPGTDPAWIAQRLLGAAVSDLAAMAARPAWFTLALTLPAADPAWLEPFAAALAQRARELQIRLVGGDTTRGPLTLSVQVHGWVAPERALTRAGAQPGDLVLVSGTLGDSHAGLQSLLQQWPATPQVAWLQQRFYRPEPRLELARALAPHLHAAIDISDGLLADLGHILEQSGQRGGAGGARLELEMLPLSEALCATVDVERAQRWALSGGEDFELCCAAPPQTLDNCLQIARQLGVKLSCIGRFEAQAGLRLVQGGVELPVSQTEAGYDHFGSCA